MCASLIFQCPFEMREKNIHSTLGTLYQYKEGHAAGTVQPAIPQHLQLPFSRPTAQSVLLLENKIDLTVFPKITPQQYLGKTKLLITVT